MMCIAIFERMKKKRNLERTEVILNKKNRVLIGAVIAGLLCLLFFTYDAISFDSPDLPRKVSERENMNWPAKPLSAVDSIIPLTLPNSNHLAGTVLGFLPGWKYQTAQQYLRYDLLTHIAVFNFELRSDGSLSYPEGWPWVGVINSAHNRGVKVLMTLFSKDSSVINKVLHSSDARTNLYINLKYVVSKYKLDGINVDLENLNRSDRGAVLNSFVRGLHEYMNIDMPQSEISFSGPPVNWGGWDFSGLADACDYVFIMAYDYFDMSSPVSGPVASLNGEYYSVTNTVLNKDHGYGKIAETNPEKLVLGVAYYGYHWITETDQPLSPNVKFVENTQFAYNAPAAAKYKRLWESSYNVPWYRYQEDGKWHQVWYEDEKSLGLKYQFALKSKLRGVGIWALGFDGSRQELWSEIKKRFYFDNDIRLAADKYRPERALGLSFVIN